MEVGELINLEKRKLKCVEVPKEKIIMFKYAGVI